MLQRTSEWYAVRTGRVTASRIADVVARTRTGYGSSRANYLADLVLERLTGEPTESYVSSAMQYGIDNEPQARFAYAFEMNTEVEEIGFVSHPTIGQAGCSPDGLVASDGLIEIKVPNPATHLQTLLTDSIDERYIKQMAFQMACTERSWCDFVSFQPKFPAHLQLYIRRVPRDDRMIAELEREVTIFLAELDQQVAALQAKFLKAAA